MRAVLIFLRARAAVINFVIRAASTLKLQMASSEHFEIFRWLLHFFAPSNLADTFKAGQYVKILSRFNHSQHLTANYALCDMPFDAELLYLASRKSGG